ncbi:hypothetical protein DLE04_01755 [Actinobacteria bacterium IMCC26103]|nr:hypothetical protein DLE04_01755 [Actinobacteria bacterium IMCC26103]
MRSLRSRKTLISLSLLLAFAALPSVASDLNSTASKYLLCVDLKSKNVTHPSSKKCPKTSKELLINSQAAQGPIGLTGAAGLNGRNGIDGKTLWNGTLDPQDLLGAPGDVYINTATKYLFGPKTLENTWPIGFSIVGPAGSQGIQGIPGFPGANGANGGQGASGATGATGAKGDAGDSGSSLSCALGGKCQIGSTGPGGGVVYYYSEAGFTMTGAPCGSSCHYLEVANLNWRGVYEVFRDGPDIKWAKTDTTKVAGAQGVAIGTGFANSEAIVTQQGACTSMASCDFAAGLARLYTGGSKNDWFLPSLYELKLIFANVSDQMYVTGRIWWSSSQDDQTATNAYGLWTGNNLYALTPVAYQKVDTLLELRPIRAF